MIFSDPPYNVRIDRNVSGLGKIKHREFQQASGEMSQAEFTTFLRSVFRALVRFSKPGSIQFQCMDWRHQREILDAAEGVYDELKNLIVWKKSNAGMGTFYRSAHELIFAFKAGNPKGRERGKRGVKTDLARAIEGQQTVSIKGEEITGSRQSLMFLMLATRAAAGDLKAANILVPLTIQIFGLEDRGRAKATLSPRDAALFHELVYGAPPEGGPVSEGDPADGSPDDAGSADTSEMDE